MKATLPNPVPPMKQYRLIHFGLLLGLVITLFPSLASAYYNPVQGRWCSRDPIEEEGGLNVYGFGRNNPVSGWDQLGRAWGPDDVIVNSDLIAEQSAREAAERERAREESLKRIAELHKVPGYLKDKCGNCSPETIQQGETKLKSLFASFATEKDDDVADQGEAGFGIIGKSSCHDVNLSLLRHMQSEIPECWACRFVHFHRFYIRLGKDHWWLECAAYDDNGNTVKGIAFDWWRKGALPGEDPSINRRSFPYLDEQGSTEIPQKVWDWEVDP